MVGFFAQQPRAAATCKAAIARAWPSRRRSGRSSDQPLAVEAINVKSINKKAINVKAHAKELPGLDGIHLAKYATNSPTASERDDSPLAMFRRMDGAALGSGAGAGAGVVLPERDETQEVTLPVGGKERRPGEPLFGWPSRPPHPVPHPVPYRIARPILRTVSRAAPCPTSTPQVLPRPVPQHSPGLTLSIATSPTASP